MSDDVSEVGGRVSIVPGPAGTEVTFVLPIPNPATRVLWWTAAALALILIESAVFHGMMGRGPPSSTER